MDNRYLLLIGLCSLLIAVWLPATTGIAIRPFKNRGLNKSSGCSTETALSGAGCYCRLNGQRCRDTGLICKNNVCVCGAAFVNVTTGGVIKCLPQFYAVPTITVGVTRSCSASVNDVIPGMKLVFTNAVLPVSCTDSTYGVVTFTATNAADLADQTNLNTYIFIDPNTGDVIGNTCDQCTPPDTFDNAAGTGNTIVQTYAGYCVDARGVPSNNFNFKIIWPNCA